MTRYQRTCITMLGCLLMVTPMLACVGTPFSAVPPLVNYEPRHACPTNTPLPFGEAGPVKEIIRYPRPTATPSGPIRYDEEVVYYEKWEREYGHLGGPPFPAPTPYTKSGFRYYIGQLINLGPDLDLQLDVEPTGIMSDSSRLYLVKTQWTNRGTPIVMQPARQLVISSVRTSEGRKLGGVWAWSPSAARLAGLSAGTEVLSMTILPGETELVLPIVAPRDQVQVVELHADPQHVNDQTGGVLHVQFVADTDPYCDHPGTHQAVYSKAWRPVVAPPAPGSAGSIVAAAMKYVHRPYCWGGKGYGPCPGNPTIGYKDACPAYQQLPCFDCSGLVAQAYLEGAGVRIAHGTANQQLYPQVALADIQPGDLMLFGGFNQNGRATVITHVGLYGGDVTGDGTGDLIHAASYPRGVIVTNNVLGNDQYRSRLVLITRPPIGSGR